MDKPLYLALELVIVCKLLATNKYTTIGLDIDNQNIARFDGLCGGFRLALGLAVVYFGYTVLAKSLFNLGNYLWLGVAVDSYRDVALLYFSISFAVGRFGNSALAQSIFSISRSFAVVYLCYTALSKSIFDICNCLFR